MTATVTIWVLSRAKRLGKERETFTYKRHVYEGD